MASTVIVIDDDDDDVLILSEAIRDIRKDADIHSFADCEAAISELIHGRLGIPEYIFIDINMPRILGSECLEILRTHRSLQDSKIIMISTTMWDRDTVKYVSQGANFAVQKPVKLEDYAGLLRKIMLR